MNFFSSNKKFGILGGGQLGKMILAATQKWDITTYVLDPNKNAPSSFCCNFFKQGDFKDFETVYNFGKKLDLITFEIEHVNLEALYKLEEEGVVVYPSPRNLSIIQDKFSQKKFYQKNNIPTAKFNFFSKKNELENALKNNLISIPFVWKSSKLGYDGYGVKVIKSKKDLSEINNVPCITEELIKYSNELSVIICRNPNEESKIYPVIEMEFNKSSNQVENVICPAQISNKSMIKAEKIALKVSKSFNHVGLLAIEMFLTEENEVLVNEVAPRPHNSGHFTIEGSLTNQFEQHLRGILNLPLGETNLISPSVMINLVGPIGINGKVSYKNIKKLLKLKGVNLHIYGKKETRPNRKLGHVTIINKNIIKAKKIAKKIKETIKIISK
jgi:5-(carboxyamino)imidazole ribonucleotide synthase